MTVRLIGTDTEGAVATGENYFRLTRFQALQTGNITEFKTYGIANGNVKCAIYEDSAGEPGDLITAMNTGQAVTADRWNTLSFTSTPVVKDTYYWLAECFDVRSAITCQIASGTFRYKAVTYATFTFPDPAGTGFSTSVQEDNVAGWGTILAVGRSYGLIIG